MTWKQSKYLSQVCCKLLLCGCFSVGLATSVIAQDSTQVRAVENCRNAISLEATRNFNQGRADDVFEALAPCLDQRGLNKGSRIDMYRLLAISHLTKETEVNDSLAVVYVKSLLKIRKNYRSSSQEDGERFKSLLEEHRLKWYQRPIWLGSIAAGVTGSVIAYRAITAEDDPLPLPPAGPQ